MKQVLLALILISPMSYADWGDTYFCTATHHSRVDSEIDRGFRYRITGFKFTFSTQEQKQLV
jgi:hypothetical protein